MRKQLCVCVKKKKHTQDKWPPPLVCNYTPSVCNNSLYSVQLFVFSSLPANHNWFPFWKKMAPQQQHMLAWHFIPL